MIKASFDQKRDGVFQVRWWQWSTCGLLTAYLVACGGGGAAPASDVNPPQADAIAGVFDGRGEPLEAQQWHLGSAGLNLPEYGLHFENTGNGIKLAVLDTAVQLNHPDLPQAASGMGARILHAEPTGITVTANTPWSVAGHGTAVAGTIAAAALGPDASDGGGRGVAPLAQLLLYPVLPTAGVSTVGLGFAVSDAVKRGARVINNSWTAVDGLGYHPPDAGWLSAVQAAAAAKPAPVMVFAAGNAAEQGQTSSQDPYANQRHVIAVAGVGRDGVAQAYSEPGSNVLIAAPGGSASDGLVTTDLTGSAGLSVDDYLRADSQVDGLNFAGTSAAAATVSGAVALMLQANSALTPREVAWILAATARPPNAETCPTSVCQGDDAIQPVRSSLGEGKAFSPRMGFGRIDVRAAVDAAQHFSGLAPERSCSSKLMKPNSNGTSSARITAGVLISATFDPSTDSSLGCPTVVERVELVFTAHADSAYNQPRFAGDLRLALSSPSDTHSVFMRDHSCAPQCGDLSSGFTFSSVRHMGEPSAGTWTLGLLYSPVGTRMDDLYFDSWQLRFVGH